MLFIGRLQAERSKSGRDEGQEASACFMAWSEMSKMISGFPATSSEIAGQGLDHGLDLLAGVIDGMGQPETGLSDRNRRKGREIQVKPVIHHPPAQFQGLLRPPDPHEPERGVRRC